MRKELERTTPESVGIHSGDILHLIDELEKCGTQMHGLMILRHGKVAAEGWWSPFAPGIRHGCQSLTKTYTSTAIGLLYDEGLVRLDERIADIFPEYLPGHVQDRIRRITVRDALCMSCGMYRMPDVSSPDWLKEYFTIEVEKEPGEGFFYNSATSTMLAAIVRQKTGLSLLEYLKPRLFERIGIDADNLRILSMPDGLDNGGGGLFATTEDNARLMQLYLNKGMWDGERVLSEEWVDMASSYQNSTEEDKGIHDCHLGYGFQMWMCRPRGVYRADGAYGQYSIVFPEQDMVISINETAELGIWPQKVLDIIWDEFMPRVPAADVGSFPEEPEAQEKLRIRLRGLKADPAVYAPAPAWAKKEQQAEYRLDDNRISIAPGVYHELTGVKKGYTEKIVFRFGRCGDMEIIFRYDGQEYPFQVGMDGNGRLNNRLPEWSIPQMTFARGLWEEENRLTVWLRYLETCFEKRFTFVFDGDELYVILEEGNSSIAVQNVVKEKVTGHKIE